MPQPCNDHPSQPQLSCETCFPDHELQSNLERMQAVKLPTSRVAEGKNKPKRLDSTPRKKRTWRDDMFGE